MTFVLYHDAFVGDIELNVDTVKSKRYLHSSRKQSAVLTTLLGEPVINNYQHQSTASEVGLKVIVLEQFTKNRTLKEVNIFFQT